MLSLRSIRKSFGDRLVLDDVDLDVQRGERIALRGPNGAGKTTLLRCVLGTVTPESGELRVCGAIAGSRAARRRIGASLAQERSFYLRLSGAENLFFFARLRGAAVSDARRQVAELSEELELAELLSAPAGRCSTGQLQQLAFARSLLGAPPVILLDEPTRSLDEQARARLWDAVARRGDVALLYATHLDDDLRHASSTFDLASR
jgi:ABC-type multidrug transport system ATPase subunit